MTHVFCVCFIVLPPVLPLLLLQVRVAVIREEGSNGDREMAAAVYAAGMEPWDITMSDLIAGRAQLDSFRGIIFVGEQCSLSAACCVAGGAGSAALPSQLAFG